MESSKTNISQFNPTVQLFAKIKDYIRQYSYKLVVNLLYYTTKNSVEINKFAYKFTILIKRLQTKE